MTIPEKQLEGYVPVSIELFEEKPKVKVVSVGIVTELRADGSYELTLPMTHIKVDTNGKPVEKWEKTEQPVHVSALEKKPYEIEQPLMPKRKVKDAETDGDAVHGSPKKG